MRNEGEDDSDEICYRYSARMYRELNEVHSIDTGSKSPKGVYWDGFSPPQRVCGRKIEAIESQTQSQSQGTQPESSPLSLLQVRHTRIRHKKIIPRSKPKSQFQRQKSMDEIRNGGITVIPNTMRPRKTKAVAKSDTKKNEEACASSSENSAENPPLTSNQPSQFPSDCDFPEDNFDEDLVLASQEVEQKLNRNLTETPKSVPKTGRKSMRQLDAEVLAHEANINMDGSLFESSTLHLESTSKPINEQINPPEPTDDGFGDQDDEFFSQLNF